MEPQRITAQSIRPTDGQKVIVAPATLEKKIDRSKKKKKKTKTKAAEKKGTDGYVKENKMALNWFYCLLY